MKKLLIFIALIIISDYGIAQTPGQDGTPRILDTGWVVHTPRIKHGNKKAKFLPDSIVITGPRHTQPIKISVQSFKEQAVEKTKEFTNYILAIADPNTTSDQADKNIDQACLLFVNEDAKVEVSNTITKVRHKYPVRDYLNRLKLSINHYSKVIVEYADIAYVPEFRMGRDGYYYSVVTFFQTFQGFIDNNIVYGDVTQKNVIVILKSHTKEKDGSGTFKLDLFLSDIAIKETRKI